MNSEQILKALKKVTDPDMGKDIVSLDYVRDIHIEDGNVSFSLALTGAVCGKKGVLQEGAKKALMDLEGIDSVDIRIVSGEKKDMHGAEHGEVQQQNLLPDVKNVVAIASGKGGVGKSTVSVNLAIALAAQGAKVGLVDLDIYGPSIPMMMGIKDEPQVEEKKFIPLESHGVKLMSLGFLVPEGTPLIWRGPMVMGAVEQLLKDVKWGDLDFLMVDLPPGTGDAQLSLTQKVPLSGVIIVTTPQDVALLDAIKGLAMFRKVDVEVLGIVENMSYFVCPKCSERTDIFHHGGGKRTSEKEDAPFLGEIPLNVQIREGGDSGNPIVISDPDGPIAVAFKNMASGLIEKSGISMAEEKSTNIDKTENKENSMSEGEDKKQTIIEALNTVRPYLQADGGDVEYVDYVDNVVQVRLKGACGTCPSALMTLQMGVERAIRERLPEIKGVVAV